MQFTEHAAIILALENTADSYAKHVWSYNRPVSSVFCDTGNKAARVNARSIKDLFSTNILIHSCAYDYIYILPSLEVFRSEYFYKIFNRKFTVISRRRVIKNGRGNSVGTKSE